MANGELRFFIGGDPQTYEAARPALAAVGNKMDLLGPVGAGATWKLINNQLAADYATLERFHQFREEAERKGFRYFLEVFDPNVPGAVAPDVLPRYLNDMISRMLAGVAPAGVMPIQQPMMQERSEVAQYFPSSTQVCNTTFGFIFA